MAKQYQNKDFFASDLFSKTIEDAKGLLKVLGQVETQVKDLAKSQKELLANNKLSNVSDINKATQAQKTLNEAERVSEKLNKDKLNLETKIKVANSDRVQSNVLMNEQLKEQNRLNRQNVLENNKVFGAYKNLSTRLVRLRREYKDLAAAEKENTKEGRKLNKEITQLDNKIKKIDKSVGQSQRNVGNYSSAWGRLGTTVKRTLAAFGIIGGIQMVSSAFRDAFNRIKEFDLEMATIRGLTGQTKEELGGLRAEIIEVARTSIKTSNEVAKLASTLLTLGKTKEEVIDLLKPVNDLAIGLKVSSDEAATLLGQTLNAFQKSSKSGQKFADIIANIRKSTSLDFIKISDSLAYVAATASTLGLTLGKTGAIIGVLQDNGVKAARAGRLLNSSFGRLIKRGLTLDEALEKIRESTDKIKTAQKLFGTESFSLGIILARNKDRIDELTNSFDNLSEGSLKTLVDEQLDTLSGKIKILDSAYEAFILSVENGNGRLSKAFKDLVGYVTDLITEFTFLNTTVDEFYNQADKEERSLIVSLITSNKDKEIVKSRIESLIVGAQIQIEKAKKDVKDKKVGFFDLLLSGDPDEAAKDYKRAQRRLGKFTKRLELLKQALKDPQKFIEQSKKKTTDTTTNNKGKIKLIDRDQITELKKLKEELKAINDLREKLVTSNKPEDIKVFKVLSDQADDLQAVIDVYERLLKNDKISEKKPIRGKLSKTDQEALDRSREFKDSIDVFEDLVTDALKTIGNLVDDLFVKKMDSLNDKLQSTQRRTDQLINKAEVSRLDAQESIAFEQKKEAKLEREREKARKKQQQAQAFFTILEAYQSNVAANSKTPITDTVRDIGILRALAQSFGSFYVGTDDLGKADNKLDNKGGRLIVAHDNEQIWSKKDRSEVGWRNRAEIKEIIKLHDSGAMSQIMGANMPEIKLSAANNYGLERKLEQLNASIKNIKIPEGTVSIDQVRKLINVKMTTGNKTKIERSRLYD